MLKLLHIDGLYDLLREFGERKPVFGTRARALVMARDASNTWEPELALLRYSPRQDASGSVQRRFLGRAALALVFGHLLVHSERGQAGGPPYRKAPYLVLRGAGRPTPRNYASSPETFGCIATMD